MLDRFKGYIKGGFGTHWKGCHKVHWDCYIVHLEEKLQAAERDIENLTKVIETLKEDKWALYKKAIIIENKVNDIEEFLIENIYSVENLFKMKKDFVKILKEYKEKRKNEE